MINDEYWMRYALAMAQCAALENEIPVGAVVVLNQQIIGYGWNRAISQHDATAHAEIMAIRRAGQTVGNYRLLEATLYVALEPCFMCAGALIHSRLKRVVYAAQDTKTGAVGSMLNLLQYPGVNHFVMAEGGCLADTCSQLLSDFFRYRRWQQKNIKQCKQAFDKR